MDKAVDKCNIEDLVRGYTTKEDNYICLECNCNFEKGRVYNVDGLLYDGYGMIRTHIEKEHGSVAETLLAQSAEVFGLTDSQMQILRLKHDGKTDAEIAVLLGISSSTVRAQNYRIKEKRCQAKQLLALLGAIEPPITNV